MKTKIKSKTFILFILLFAILLILSGCEGNRNSPTLTPILSSIEIKSSSIGETGINIAVNESIELTAVGHDQNGEVMSINPIWSITGDIGEISPETGTTVTFTSSSSAGNGEITASQGDISKTITVNISQEPAVLTSIEISPESVSVVSGDTRVFSSIGKDQYGENIAFTTPPAWSVTGNIGTVSPTDGNSTTFTASNVGEGSISAAVGNIIGTAELAVVQQAPVLTRIEIFPDTEYLGDIYETETVDFTVTGYDQYNQQLSCNPSWSISPKLGTFSPADGETTTFTANSSGTATITTIDGIITDSVDITIKEAPGLAEIVISPASPPELYEGDTQNFYASGYDQYGNYFLINPEWSVTGNIGTVAPQTGTSINFTATTPGSGTVVVSEGEFSDSAEVTVKPNTLYVPGDYSTIQEAVDAAEDGMTIIVSEGTYNECISISSKDLTLKSTGPDTPSVVENTIINGGGNCSTITISGASTNTVTIEGFTITGGSGSDLIGSTLHYGGGVHVHTAETILRNNIISGNEAYDGGGGIYGYMCDMTLEENIIENNTSYLAGGGISLGAGSGYTLIVDITDNIIRNNTSEDRNSGGIYTWNVEGTWSGNIIDGNSAATYAGGIDLNYSSPDIINNQIINNNAEDMAGISVGKNSCPTIQNNTISGNQSESINSHGGGLNIGSEGLVLSGNEISNNSAATGAGICTGAAITLDNNNISANTASSTGGGIYTKNDITLTNNTIDSNTATQGGGIALYAENKVLTASGNEFTNNSKYAILLHPGASWVDNGGNTFSGNSPENILQ